MSNEALGGGVMVAVAAILWVAYLMPTWARRRQYQATERNAVRLQQTLRILAETAEVPQQVRLEANARTVAEQQRLLARSEQAERREAQAVADAATSVRRAAAAVAAAASAAAAPPEKPAAKLRRLRRFRGLVTLFLLGGFVLSFFGLFAAVAGSFTALVGGGVMMVAAFGILGRLATVARSARVVQAPVPVQLPVRIGQPFEPVHFEDAPVASVTWTPQPMPRALHLSRGSIAQTAMASVEAANELRKAAAEAEVGRRAAALAEAGERTVVPIARGGAASGAAASAAATGGVVTAASGSASAASAGAASSTLAAVPSRFAAMGIVGETEPGMSDLDAVLRRRRAV